MLDNIRLAQEAFVRYLQRKNKNVDNAWRGAWTIGYVEAMNAVDRGETLKLPDGESEAYNEGYRWAMLDVDAEGEI